jgi:hypothetical protein
MTRLPMRARAGIAATEVYRRGLPGGGYAVIEIEAGRRLWNREYRGRVVVERRAVESRRAGHAPPVVIETRARTPDDVLTQLIPVVLSNTALANRCLSLTRPG